MSTAVGPIVVGISDMLFGKLCQLSFEEYSPSRGADESDDTIKRLRKEITELRRIRNELENLCSGSIL